MVLALGVRLFRVLQVAELLELEAGLTWGTAGGCERDACAGGCDVGADACHKVSAAHKKDMECTCVAILVHCQEHANYWSWRRV